MSQPRCSHTTARGTPCRKRVAVGYDACVAHIGKVGRPHTLTDDVADQIVASLRAGNYITTATKAAGVSRITFNGWIARGRSQATRDAPFRALRERVEKARAEGEARNVAIIANAARESWQAAAWLLERTAPERWGRVSVRMRDPEQAKPPAQPEPKPGDPFAEVDELAQRRRSGA